MESLTKRINQGMKDIKKAPNVNPGLCYFDEGYLSFKMKPGFLSH